MKRQRTNRKWTAGLSFALALAIVPLASAVTTQGLTDANQTPFYLGGTPNAVHQDGRNSDFYPWVMPSNYKNVWQALNRTNGNPGAGIFTGPSQGIDGALIQTDSRGSGWSSLHKLNQVTGELITEVDEWDSDCKTGTECFGEDPYTPDFLTSDQGPVVDVYGNIYVADLDQY